MRRAVFGLLVFFLLAISGCDNLSVPVATSTPPPPTTAPILPTTPPAPTANDPATPAPSPTPPPIPTSTPVPLMVGKTGGDGIWLRSAPSSLGKKLKAWPDGTNVVVVGPDQTVGNQTWKNVRDPDGSVGWIAAEFLVPTAATGSARTPTTLPSGAARPTSTPTP